MPEYAWKAINSEGQTLKGKLFAQDEAALAKQLDQSGNVLVSAKLIRPSFSLGKGKVGIVQLISFSFQMGLLLRAGVPIFEALRDISNAEESPAFREVIAKISEALSSGKSLSQALAMHPKVFNEVYVNLVRAGETTGQLPEILENLTETLKWQNEMASQAKKAMVYPIIVSIVITGVLTFMLMVVVPQIGELLKTMRIPLPMPTKVLLWMSDQLLNHWKLIFGSIVALVLSTRLLLRVPGRMRNAADRLVLKLPLVGNVLMKIALARFSYVLALLYASGITVMDALKVVEKAVGNRAMSDAIRTARLQISKGRTLSAAFSGTDLFPPMVVSMLRVGEATGSLDTSLKNVSYLYTREARDAVDQLQATIQPVMTVVLGLILALIMVFTLGPLYESVVGRKGGGL